MNCNDFHQPTDPLPSEGKVICILGPNKLQNYPLLTSAQGGASTTTVAGSLNSLPSTTYWLDFYTNLLYVAKSSLMGAQYLLFNVSDFNGFTVGGEWAIGLGEYFEAGVGLGYYQDTVTTVYDEWVNDNGSEIMQDLRFRIVPITAIARILPLGNKRAFQPYVGAGLGIYNWNYSETGEFVDFFDNSIYRDRYVASGTSVGPVAVFGARGRLSRSFTLGMEVRLQWGEADLSQDFLGDKLDLSGTSILSTFTYRF